MPVKFYSNWLRPQDLHHRLCAVLSRSRATAVFLEVMRPRGWGRFEHSDIECCRLMLPHLQRVLRTQHRLAELEVERDAAFDALDHLPWGVVLVDHHGNRLVANRRAQEILMAGDGLMAHGDSLRAELADETARLDRVLCSALKGAGDQAPSAGARTSSGRNAAAILQHHPLAPEQPAPLPPGGHVECGEPVRQQARTRLLLEGEAEGVRGPVRHRERPDREMVILDDRARRDPGAPDLEPGRSLRPVNGGDKMRRCDGAKMHQVA
jgi:hypothetical protein